MICSVDITGRPVFFLRVKKGRVDLGERKDEGGDWQKERERKLYSGCMDEKGMFLERT